jgi:diguanylate cyclase (GGDEF)-like protein
MDWDLISGDQTTLLLQFPLTLLFGLVFLFLWRQSRVVYFGLWSLAWAVRSAAFPAEYLASRGPAWLALHVMMQFACVVLLFAAGRAGFPGLAGDWRWPLRLLLALPVFPALTYASGSAARTQNWRVLYAVALCSVYLYNCAGVRVFGVGGHVFRFSLLSLASLFLYQVMSGVPAWSGWARPLPYHRLCDLALHALLTFAALAMWIEKQGRQSRDLDAELERVRREIARNKDVDNLTGLLNHAALDRRIQETAGFRGVVAVCDMNNFKEVNDRYGHLTGDEILRSIGHLLHSSIRREDEAFRWGGDEFVILFRNQDRELVNQRMQELRNRLQLFHVRGHGTLPISFSWGTAQSDSRPLREALDEADREMYAQKGNRRT